MCLYYVQILKALAEEPQSEPTVPYHLHWRSSHCGRCSALLWCARHSKQCPVVSRRRPGPPCDSHRNHFEGWSTAIVSAGTSSKCQRQKNKWTLWTSATFKRKELLKPDSFSAPWHLMFSPGAGRELKPRRERLSSEEKLRVRWQVSGSKSYSIKARTRHILAPVPHH